MTYCLAAKVRDGLVFASDSRTNAGVDHVSIYSKMHIFGMDEERQLVLLSAGNLATTQAVVAKLKREIRESASESLFTVRTVEDAADLVGRTVVYDLERHGTTVTQAGFSPEVTFIVGGQIFGAEPELYMVYPQGNFISTSKETRYLQIGEAKYGKPLLERIIGEETSLDAAALCALLSMDTTMANNATVGPPIEILAYERDSFSLSRYRMLAHDDEYLLNVRRSWSDQLGAAFRALPGVIWSNLPDQPPS